MYARNDVLPWPRGKSLEERDRYWGHATFYAMVLIEEGYAPDEAAALVVERYPLTRPVLELLLRAARKEAV